MKFKMGEEAYTLSAFLLGFFLTLDLSSTEQNQLGNWFMLVGQTLCTSATYKFNNDWRGNNRSVSDMLNNVKINIDKVNNMMK